MSEFKFRNRNPASNEGSAGRNYRNRSLVNTSLLLICLNIYPVSFIALGRPFAHQIRWGLALKWLVNSSPGCANEGSYKNYEKLFKLEPIEKIKHLRMMDHSEKVISLSSAEARFTLSNCAMFQFVPFEAVLLWSIRTWILFIRAHSQRNRIALLHSLKFEIQKSISSLTLYRFGKAILPNYFLISEGETPKNKAYFSSCSTLRRVFVFLVCVCNPLGFRINALDFPLTTRLLIAGIPVPSSEGGIKRTLRAACIIPSLQLLFISVV